jgi:hypothetical protein
MLHKHLGVLHFKTTSYGNGFTQDLLSNFRLERLFRDQIHTLSKCGIFIILPLRANCYRIRTV